MIFPTAPIILSPAAIVEVATALIVVVILPILLPMLLTLESACSLAPLFSSAAVAICSIEDFSCSMALTLSCALSNILPATPARLSLICCCFANVLCLRLSTPLEETTAEDEPKLPFLISAILFSFILI